MPTLLTPLFNLSLDDYPTALTLSRDGALLAAATASGRVTLHASASGETQHVIEAHRDGVLALGFGRRLLASAGQDGHARLWDPLTGAAVAALPGSDSGKGWVSQLQWTPDGKRLATASGKVVRLWDEQGALLREWTAPAGINGLAFNAVGGLLAASAGAEVLLWRCADGGLDRILKWVSTLINTHWSPDGKVLAAGSLDKSVHFWRAGAWLDSKMGGYERKPQALAWSADSRQLATSGEDAIIVWNFSGKGPEGSKPLQLQHHLRAPDVLVAHPKKQLLLSGSPDKTVVLWDLKTGTALGHAQLNGAVTALALHPSQPLAYACGRDGQLAGFRIEPL